MGNLKALSRVYYTEEEGRDLAEETVGKNTKDTSARQARQLWLLNSTDTVCAAPGKERAPPGQCSSRDPVHMVPPKP